MGRAPAAVPIDAASAARPVHPARVQDAPRPARASRRPARRSAATTGRCPPRTLPAFLETPRRWRSSPSRRGPSVRRAADRDRAGRPAGEAGYLELSGRCRARWRACWSGERRAEVQPGQQAGPAPAGGGGRARPRSRLTSRSRRTCSIPGSARTPWRAPPGITSGCGCTRAAAEDGLTLGAGPTERASEEADLILRLRPVMEAQLRDRDVDRLYRDVELPLAEVLARMERVGVAIDTPALRALSETLRQRLAALTEEICRQAGTEFNIGSPKQLGFVLFEKLQLPPLKKTKTGYSTDAEVLEQLAPQHAVVARILEHRELSKLLGTYVDVLPGMVDPRDRTAACDLQPGAGQHRARDHDRSESPEHPDPHRGGPDDPPHHRGRAPGDGAVVGGLLADRAPGARGSDPRPRPPRGVPAGARTSTPSRPPRCSASRRRR